MAGHIFIIGKWASFRGNATAGICDAEAGMRGKSISGMDFALCGKLHEQANQHRWKNNMRSRPRLGGRKQAACGQRLGEGRRRELWSNTDRGKKQRNHREDASLIYSGHAPKNLSVILKIAMTLLKKAGQPNISIFKKQRLVSYKRDFLEELLPLS